MTSMIALTLYASLAIKIPNVNDTVATSGGKSSVLFMICRRVDWEHKLHVFVTRCLFLSVTAEGIVGSSVLVVEPSKSRC
jgi:hypothetical protein